MGTQELRVRKTPTLPVPSERAPTARAGVSRAPGRAMGTIRAGVRFEGARHAPLATDMPQHSTATRGKAVAPTPMAAVLQEPCALSQHATLRLRARRLHPNIVSLALRSYCLPHNFHGRSAALSRRTAIPEPPAAVAKAKAMIADTVGEEA